MNKQRVLINDFSLGMISRRLQGDAEMMLATRAAERIENGYLTPDGGISRRPCTGMVYSDFLELETGNPWSVTAGGKKMHPTFDAFRDTDGEDVNEQLKVVSSSRDTNHVDILEMHTGQWNPVLKEVFIDVESGVGRDDLIEVYKKKEPWIEYFEFLSGGEWSDPSEAMNDISGTTEAAASDGHVLIDQKKETPTSAIHEKIWYCKKDITCRVMMTYRAVWTEEGSWRPWDGDETYRKGKAWLVETQGRHVTPKTIEDAGSSSVYNWVQYEFAPLGGRSLSEVEFKAGHTYNIIVSEDGGTPGDMVYEDLYIELPEKFNWGWGDAEWVGGPDSTIAYDILQRHPIKDIKFRMKKDCLAKVTTLADDGVVQLMVNVALAGMTHPIATSLRNDTEKELDLKAGSSIHFTLDSNGRASGEYRFKLELVEREVEKETEGPQPDRYEPTRLTKTERLGFAIKNSCWFFKTGWTIAYSRAIKFAVDVLGRTVGYDGDSVYMSAPYGQTPDTAPEFPDISDHDIRIRLARQIAWIEAGDQLYVGNGEKESFFGAPMGFYTNESGGIVVRSLTQGGAKMARANQYGLFYLLQDNTIGVATERRVVATDDYLDRSDIVEFAPASDKGGLAILALDEERNLWMSRLGEHGFSWWILDTDVLWFALWGNELLIAKQRHDRIGIELLPVLDGLFFRKANRIIQEDLADAVMYRHYAKDEAMLYKTGFKTHRGLNRIGEMRVVEYLASGEITDLGIGNWDNGMFFWSDDSGRTESNIVSEGEAKDVYFIPHSGLGIDDYQRPKLYIKTLPIHIPSVYGHSLHKPQRITSIVVSVDKTRGIRVRTGGTDWEEKTFDEPYTGTLEFSLNSGYDVEVTVEVESVGNLPLHVQKIQADVTIGDT